MDGADSDLPLLHQVRHAHALGARVREIELACDALLEHVQMLRQGNVRLHDVQVVDEPRIHLGQAGSEKVRMLLIVAFDADAVFRFQHRFEKPNQVLWRHKLALNHRAGAFEPCRFAESQAVPLPMRIPLHDISLMWHSACDVGATESRRSLLDISYATDIFHA